MNNTTYSTGTVSVGANSTTVTGVGTAWLTNGIRAGDVIILAGLLVVISSVGSNTSITLRRGWPGAAQSGADYDILLLDDEVRSLTAANTLLGTLSNGTLSSLAGLSSAANKMAYFSGEGVMALADLTTEARSVLASNLLSRSGNNLVTASLARFTGGVVQSSVTDATAGRALTVGAFGLGGGTPTITGAQLDDLQTVGFFRMGESSGDATVGSQIFNLYAHSNYTRQILFLAGSSVQKWRQKNAGVWSPWALISAEGGSNANGRYVRLPDGTQICYHTVSMGYASSTLLTIPSSWTFPAAFSAYPSMGLSLSNQVSDFTDLSMRDIGAVVTYLTSTVTGVFNVNKVSGGVGTWTATSEARNVRLMAIGRWY